MTTLVELKELKNIQADILTLIKNKNKQVSQSSDELAQNNKDIEEYKKLLLNIEQKIRNINIDTATRELCNDLLKNTNSEEFYKTIHKYYGDKR